MPFMVTLRARWASAISSASSIEANGSYLVKWSLSTYSGTAGSRTHAEHWQTKIGAAGVFRALVLRNHTPTPLFSNLGPIRVQGPGIERGHIAPWPPFRQRAKRPAESSSVLPGEISLPSAEPHSQDANGGSEHAVRPGYS